jgi:hypothetical protein
MAFSVLHHYESWHQNIIYGLFNDAICNSDNIRRRMIG